MGTNIIGTLKRHPDFVSRFVAARNIDVWLPPGYDGKHPLPVIYMQDGHNLFDPAVSNGGEVWAMDRTVTRLAGDGVIPAAIVVGIWDTARRFREYMPRKPLAMADEKRQARFARENGGMPLSDAYLRFLIEEVKPLVDRTCLTQADRAHTFIMGSSMGALLSLYALCEYPDVFGGAGCLSTHWPAGDGIMVDYLKTALPQPGRHRIYFDYGTQTLDALYEPYQMRVDKVMRATGCQEDRDWMTRRFEGAEHNERAWRERVKIPLKFLLSPWKRP